MKKYIKFIIIVIMCLLNGCGNKGKLDASWGTSSDVDSLNDKIRENLSGDSKAYIGKNYYDEENRFKKGQDDIKEKIELSLFDKTYDLSYEISKWDLGYGWRDYYICMCQDNEDKKITNYTVEALVDEKTGEYTYVANDRYAYTDDSNYMPSPENSKNIKNADELRELAKKYLEEIYGDIDYDRFEVTEDFDKKQIDHGDITREKLPCYRLDYCINGVKTLDYMCVYMNKYGDFLSCSRENSGIYDNLDVDYLVEKGLLTDEAYDVAKKKIEETYDDNLTEFEVEKDYLCMNKQDRPIRIISCRYKIKNEDENIQNIVVEIKD